MSLIDDMLAYEQARIDSTPAPEPTPYDTKVGSLDSKYEEKKQRVEPAIIKYQDDGDTTTFTDSNKSMRAEGFDAFEVPHYQDPNASNYNDPAQVDYRRRDENRMERQREQLSQMWGVPIGEVSNKDVYREGVKDNLTSLYNKTKSPNDVDGNGIRRGDEGYQDWTPGPISDEWTTATAENPQPARLGSEESPLNIAIGRMYSGGSAQGRTVGKEFNIQDPENITNVNDSMTGGHNATVFTDGKMDHDATEDRRAELLGWKGTAPSKMDSYEEIKNYETFIRNDQGYFDKLSAMTSAAEKGMARDILRVAGKGLEAVGIVDDAEELAKSAPRYDGMSDKQKEIIMSYDKDNPDASAIFDQRAGLTRSARGKFSSEMDDAEKLWASGAVSDKAKSIWKVAKNAPELIAQSVPESAATMTGVGIAVLVSTRTDIQNQEFKQNNKRDMDAGELAIAMAWNTANLVAEKFGIKKAGQVLKDGVIKAGKSSKFVMDTLTAIGAGGILFEGLQEYSEGLADEYTTQKKGERTLGEIASDPKQIFQGVVGGVMGGSMTGGAKVVHETVKAPITAAKAYGEHRTNKKREAVGEYTNSDDVEFVKENKKASVEENEATGKEIDNAKTALEEASSFEELRTSSNETVREHAAAFEKNAQKKVELGSKEHKDSIADGIAGLIEKHGEDTMKPIAAKLGIDIEGKSKEEIRKQIDDLSVETLQEMEKNKEGVSGLGTAEVGNQQKLLEEKFEEFKTNSIAILDAQKTRVEETGKKLEKAGENFDKGVENKGETKTGTMDIDNVSKDKASSLTDIIIEASLGMFGIKSGSKVKELNKYSDSALDAASKDIETKTKELKKKTTKEAKEERNKLEGVLSDIKKVKKSRESAKESTLLDGKGNKKVRNIGQLKGDKKGTLAHLTDALIQKKMLDTRDVDATRELIKSAEEQEFLTPGQVRAYNKRLDKISKGHAAPTQEVLDKEQKQREQDQKNTGKSDVEVENEQKIEIEESDVDNNIDEIINDATEHNKKAEDFEETIEDKENLTPEEKKTREEFEKNKKKIDKRFEENIRKKYQFTQAEMELNNDFGALDEYFDGSEEIDINEAFSPEELAILNIC